jgi:ketosteroid isomerase-like protein
MRTLLLSMAIAMTLVAPALAHEKTAAPAASSTAIDPALKDAVAVVEQFGNALKAGDMAAIRELLDENVVILESGGAERSREEYLGHHAIADAKFLGGATVSILRRHGAVHGDLAWVGSESELRAGEGSQAKTLLSTETMVLQRQPKGWRIVHIHWSSRPKKAGTS